jgi:hypothetical protein
VPYLLVRHVHIVVTKRQGDGKTTAGIFPPKQDIGGSVARLLAGDSHAYYGGNTMRPRQEDGAGMNDNYDNVFADFSDGLHQGVFFRWKSKADTVSASVVFAGKSSVVACEIVTIAIR